MNRSLLLSSRLALGLGLLLLGLRPISADDASTVVAHVGNTELHPSDVRSLLDSLTPDQQRALQHDPAALSQAVKTLLIQQLVLKEAEAKKWDQQPSVVAQLARLRDATIMDSYLQSLTQPPADYPSEADLKAAYGANKAALLVPKQYRLAQIYIAVPKGSDPAAIGQAKSKLDDVRKSLARPGADFGAIARIQSDDVASAERGGEIGWVSDTQVQPEIRAKVTSLVRGVPSDPVRLADGWHILELLDLKEPYTASFAEARPQLVQRLRAQKAQANRQAYLVHLLQKNSVAVNDGALAQLLGKPDGTSSPPQNP